MKQELKDKIKEKKGEIITGLIFMAVVVAGVTYVVITNKRLVQDENDIELLRDVMSRDVIGTVKESLRRRLRYHEGRINNAIKNDNMITVEDLKLHKEEVEQITNQLFKLDSAEMRLNQ